MGFTIASRAIIRSGCRTGTADKEPNNQWSIKLHNTSGSTPHPDASSRNIQTPDHEIDLIEVVRSLWASRLLIIAITVAVTLLAGIYTLMTTPVYQVKSVLRAPQLSSLAQLNATKLYSLAPMDALYRVGAELESYDTRWTFYRDNFELFAGLHEEEIPLEQSFERFPGNAFKIVRSQGGNPTNTHVEIQLEYPEGVNGAAIVNGLVAYAIQRETQRILNDFNRALDNSIASLKQRIDALNKVINSTPSQHIARSATTASSNFSPEEARAPNNESQIAQMVLAASFSLELAKHRSEMTILENLRQEQHQLQLVRIDQPAHQPLAPIKPRKGLILAIGLVLGGMLGVMIALLRMAFSKPVRIR